MARERGEGDWKRQQRIELPLELENAFPADIFPAVMQSEVEKMF